MRGVVFDVETSGVDPVNNEITQLAAVAVVDWQEVDCLEVKAKFSVEAADPVALEKNHFTVADWADAVDQSEMVMRFAAFLQRHANIKKSGKNPPFRPYYVARLIGHNVKFDADFMNETFKRHHRFVPADSFRPLCTMQKALWHFAENPDLLQPKDYKLQTLCDYFGIPINGAHDALVDVRATFKLARKLHELSRPPKQSELF